MSVALSVDVEQDFPPHFSTFKGLEGLEVISRLLEEHGCQATFFVCAELLDSHPEILDFVKGFEVGCHGLRHLDLARLSGFQVEGEIAEAVETFREHGLRPRGFRAPYCSVNNTVLEVVRKYFEYDSSMQFHSFGRMPGLREAPVFTGGKMFGISPALFKLAASLPVKNKVFFIHPWEYGGLDFKDMMERRGDMRVWGYSGGNYLTNLERLLDGGTCAVKDVL